MAQKYTRVLYLIFLFFLCYGFVESNPIRQISTAMQVVDNVTTVGKNSLDPDRTNGSCVLTFGDRNIHHVLHELRRESYGLIFLNLKFGYELPDSIKTIFVEPLLWIWATENFGINVLLFKELVPLLLYRFINLGIANRDVSILSFPDRCLQNQTVDEYRRLVTNLFHHSNATQLESGQRAQICKLELTSLIYLGREIPSFKYDCYSQEYGHEVVKEVLTASFSMLLFNFLYSSFFLFLSFFVMFRIFESVFLFHESGECNLDLGGNTCYENILLSDVRRNFISGDDPSVELLPWLYDNLVNCKVHQMEIFGKCCNAPVFTCMKTITWLACLRLIMFIILISFIFAILVIRLILLFTYGNDDFEIRRDFLKTHKNYSLLDLNIMRLICYILFMLSVILFGFNKFLKGCIIRCLNSRYDFKALKARALEYNVKGMKSRLIKLTLRPFRHRGIFGCLCLPFSCCSLLTLACLHTPYRVYIAYFAVMSNSQRCCILAFIVFVIYPFSTVISDLITLCLGNIVLCIVIVIIHYSTYLKYLSLSFAIVFYARECITNLKRQYAKFHIKLHKYIRDKIMITFNVKGKKCFLIAVEYDEHSIKLVNNRADLLVERALPVCINEHNQLLISRSFYERSMALRKRGFPGPLFANFVSTILHLIVISLFLLFVILIVVIFGDEYIGSNINQMIATLVGSIIPWLLSNWFFSETSNLSVDVEDKEFQTDFKNLVMNNRELLKVACDIRKDKSSSSAIDVEFNSIEDDENLQFSIYNVLYI